MISRAAGSLQSIGLVENGFRTEAYDCTVVAEIDAVAHAMGLGIEDLENAVALTFESMHIFCYNICWGNFWR